MNLYLIRQSVNTDYDSYDSAVVAAENEETARRTHPSEFHPEWPEEEEKFGGTWVTAPDQVEVQLIGVAESGTPAGVICSSFNAG